ncbi:MAG: hypothetical protein PWP08_273 [Methanofollis sp.]|nr:hypothetical protein [Methanofollis sp.]
MATKAPDPADITGGLCCLLLSGLLVVSAGAASVNDTAGLNVTFQKGIYTDLFASGQTADAGYLLGGFGYETGNDSALVIKVDANGTEQWSAAPGGDSVAAIVPLEDGDAVVGTYTIDGGFLTVTDVNNATGSSRLVRIDAAGTPIWSITVEGLRLTDLVEQPDGGIAVTGWIWKPDGKADAFLGLYSLSGSEIWTQTYADRSARTLDITSDGSFIVGGTARPTIDTPDVSWLMKTNVSGTEIWTQEYANRSLLTLLPMNDGNCLLGGSMTEPYGEEGSSMIATYAWTAKVDDTGVITWERQIPGVEIDAMTELPEIGYALAGRWGSDPQIQIIDYDGNVRDGQVWNAWKGRLSSVAITDSGEIVASGWSGMNGNAGGWLVSSAIPACTETPGTTPSQTEAPGFAVAGACAALAAAGIMRKKRD